MEFSHLSSADGVKLFRKWKEFRRENKMSKGRIHHFVASGSTPTS